MTHTKLLQEQVAKLYLMFCWPRGILNLETGELEITYHWTNDDAKRLYDILQEQYTDALKAEYIHANRRHLTEQRR